MFTDLSNPSVFYFRIFREGKRKYRLEMKRGDLVICERTLSTDRLAYEFGKEWVAAQCAYRDRRDLKLQWYGSDTSITKA